MGSLCVIKPQFGNIHRETGKKMLETVCFSERLLRGSPERRLADIFFINV